jgi:hypothetical protein
MGTSTDGQLSYGVLIDEEFEFPWDAKDYGGDIEEWWRDVRGFKNPVESPFNEYGQHKPGFSDASPEVREYIKNRLDWVKWFSANPVPVQLVNYCRGDYPMYLLASKHVRASSGCPKMVGVEFLGEVDVADKTLREFLDEFGIEHNGKIGWWLSSY